MILETIVVALTLVKARPLSSVELGLLYSHRFGAPLRQQLEVFLKVSRGSPVRGQASSSC